MIKWLLSVGDLEPRLLDYSSKKKHSKSWGRLLKQAEALKVMRSTISMASIFDRHSTILLLHGSQSRSLALRIHAEQDFDHNPSAASNLVCPRWSFTWHRRVWPHRVTMHKLALVLWLHLLACTLWTFAWCKLLYTCIEKERRGSRICDSQAA